MYALEGRKLLWRRIVRALIGAAALLLLAGGASAQGGPGLRFGVMGGADFPVQDRARVFDTGWNAGALLAFNFGDSPFGIRVDGAYNEIHAKAGLEGFVGTGKARIISGTADMVVGPRHGAVQPYFIGGVGVYDLRFSGQEINSGNVFADSTTRFGWNAGLGFAFALAPSDVRVFVEGRYTSVSTDGNRFSDSVHTGGRRFTFVPVNMGVIF
jgi:opacity protein-like surface antigen